MAQVVIVNGANAIPSGFSGVSPGTNVPVAFFLRGTTNNLPYAIIGRFNMDGTNSASNINTGLMDVNIAQYDGSSRTFTKVQFTGSYNMGSYSLGTALFTITNPPWAGIPNPLPTSMSFLFTLSIDGTFGDMTENDFSSFATGTGGFVLQDTTTTDFSASAITGPYAFGLSGPGGVVGGGSGVQHGVVGRLDLSTGSIQITSMADDESGSGTKTLSGTYLVDDATNGHGVLTITVSGQATPVMVGFYVGGGPGQLFVLETDANAVPPAGSPPRGILQGAARKVAGGAGTSFTNASIGGPNVFQMAGINGAGHSSVAIAVFTGTAGATAGAGTLSGVLDQNDGGTVTAGGTLTGATFSNLAANGRGTFAITVGAVTYNFVFYLHNAGAIGLGTVTQSEAFFLEQPASDSTNRGRSGNWTPQYVTTPVKADGVGTNTTFIAGVIAGTTNTDLLDVLILDGTSSTGGTYTGNSNAGASGTFTITDANNGRGTFTPSTGDGSLFGNTSLAFDVIGPDFVWAIGTGSSAFNPDPQVIELDQ